MKVYDKNFNLMNIQEAQTISTTSKKYAKPLFHIFIITYDYEKEDQFR
jgi:hypothetical protein